MSDRVRRQRFWLVGGALPLSIVALLWVALSLPVSLAPHAAAQQPEKPAPAKSPEAQPRQVQINLDRAVAVPLPTLKQDLQAASFMTPDGRAGWALRIPGGRPIATPAYADGMIFVGGGYGSHEFYAFDAQTGALRWQAKTSDDGPTAAVVEDGYVAFNTESCTVIVVEAHTGKLVWQEWLGDPLMSQPAIANGRLYMAFPAGQRSQQQMNQVQSANVQAAVPTQPSGRGTGHRLLCADLRTGKHIWEQEITADVISAPVISGDKIYLTCFDGTSFALNASDGSIIWRKENASTSAPLVAGDQVVITQKEQSGKDNFEGLKRVDAERGEERDKKLIARERAGYLDENKGGGVGVTTAAQATLDASVGFANAPASAQLTQANKHLGVNTVAGGWAYQGSRAAYRNGRMLNAQGRYLNSISLTDGRFAWRAEITGRNLAEQAQVFSPPALGAANMYLASLLGHLIAVSQQDGATQFIYAFNQPMAFQPALAAGNIYAGTANGLLICLKTGNPDADGWYAWGGNAQHNKSEK